ncbi:MAG: hypothetical protein JWN66_4409 [Sphingomonas bacterium]|jgi:hypothetical protein|uniref:hypothetical protein n=1 Tax=Sphingomonas bacterium TaxID=1895847 RepID=UPI002615B4E4|nr:hypothetical protein [Sphingomonas bacterium]MDB5707293.1 hypothetical protein [Sphingomonas bacterium]
MGAMQPPPPRYRIVERQGRLIVTDTWAEGRPTRANTPVTPMAGTPKPSMPVSQNGPRPAPGGGLIDVVGARLVSTLCAGATDGAGQPILTTVNYCDAKGPREIVLGPASARRLGRWLVAIVAAVIAFAMLLYAVPESFIALFALIWLGAGTANSVARPALTRWLDNLDQG